MRIYKILTPSGIWKAENDLKTIFFGLFWVFVSDSDFIINMIIENQSFGNLVGENKAELRFVDFLNWNFGGIDGTLVDDLLAGVQPEGSDGRDEGGGHFPSLIHHHKGEPFSLAVVPEELVEELIIIVFGHSWDPTAFALKVSLNNFQPLSEASVSRCAIPEIFLVVLA